MKKSAYFRSPSQTGYFQSNEPEWYKKPFIWTVDGIKTMGTTIDELIS